MKRSVRRLRGRRWPPMRDRRAAESWPTSKVETTVTRISCRRLASVPIAPLDGESQHNRNSETTKEIMTHIKNEAI